MKIYIASSWKNVHAVVMLTNILRARGQEVVSFVENNYGEHDGAKPVDFEEWILTPEADKSFKFDTDGATRSDLVIYISPSGTDAWAEVGAAWASGVPVLGLHAKGEQSGLMRKMIHWHPNVTELMLNVDEFERAYEGVMDIEPPTVDGEVV